MRGSCDRHRVSDRSGSRGKYQLLSLEIGSSSAMGAAEGSTALGSGFLFFKMVISFFAFY